MTPRKFSPTKGTRCSVSGTVALGLLLAGTTLHAQSLPATAPLPPEHWVHQALGRMADAGLLYGVWTPSMAPASRALAGAALDSAAARSLRGNSGVGSLALSAAARFREEQGPWSGEPDPALRATPGVDFGSVRRQAGEAHATTRLELSPVRRFAIMVGPSFGNELGEWSFGLESAALTVGLGPVRADLARTGFRLGVGAAGLLLDDAVALDALTFRTEGPVRLPGPFRLLGPVDAGVLVSRVAAVTPDTTGTDPWLLAARVSVSPHPRLQLGVNRLITGVTKWHGQSFSVRDAVYVAVGKHTDFDDQKASLDARLLLDAFGYPFAVYGEFGFEDSAGALYADPGVLLGAHLPRLPGLGLASVRWEYTAFGARACFADACGTRSAGWFRHPRSGRIHTAADGTPLGHPLGGYGSEHRVQAVFWLEDAGVRVEATGLLRHREESNLLFSRWGPESVAAKLEASWSPDPNWGLQLALEAERGGNVLDHRLRLGIGRAVRGL